RPLSVGGIVGLSQISSSCGPAQSFSTRLFPSCCARCARRLSSRSTSEISGGACCQTNTSAYCVLNSLTSASPNFPAFYDGCSLRNRFEPEANGLARWVG